MDKSKIRYIIGIICILGSFGGMSSGQPLPSIFMLLFGLSLLPIIYQKINVIGRIKNIQIIAPIIVFVLFIIAIGSVGNNSNTNQNNNSNDTVIEENKSDELDKQSQENNTNETLKNQYILDVPSFDNITYNQLIEKMGNPTDNDTYTVDGKTAKIYIYDEKYEFMFYNDKLIRLTICAYEFEELKNLNSINEFCEKLNITGYSTKNKSADTGYASRYKDLTNSIKDFWITGLGEPDYLQIKITFDTNGFNI